MKNDKIEAEEQDADKLGKTFSERKIWGRKWFVILCLSGKQMCITYVRTTGREL